MIKKIKEEAGLTMVEMLASTLILTLLALMLGTGLQMVLHSYETMIAKSEMQILVSTAVDAIADELRYAQDVEKLSSENASAEGTMYHYSTNFKYISDTFYGVGNPVVFKLDSKGQIKACRFVETPDDPDDFDDPDKGMRVLSTGVYGNRKGVVGIYTTYKEYNVTDLEVTFDDNSLTGEEFFNIYLKVETADHRISVETPNGGVKVRCLNPSSEDDTTP